MNIYIAQVTEISAQMRITEHRHKYTQLHAIIMSKEEITKKVHKYWSMIKKFLSINTKINFIVKKVKVTGKPLYKDTFSEQL